MNRIDATPGGRLHSLPPAGVVNVKERSGVRRDRRWARLLRWLEQLLVLVTVVAFATVGFDFGRAQWDLMSARRALNAARTHAAAAETTGVAAGEERWRAPAAALPTGDVERSESSQPPTEAASLRTLVGELQIPRVDLSTMVYDVRDATDVRHAAGHIRGTSLPWQPGNSALAGHRDSAFRQLRYVRPGDDVRIVTPYGNFDYRVTRAFIVRSDEVWVLNADAAALTLITCFPFRWVGTAPERWVIQAARVPS